MGICELGENTRKMCFDPSGEKRPTNFVDGNFLFERVKEK